jgi:uncharacterized protein
VLVVVATSARMLAQSARRGGLRPVALDVFGDLDTRQAAYWVSIAHARRKGIDPERMEALLARLARHPGVLGWVAGGGLEDRLEVMAQCSQALPMIGNDTAAVAATKDPAGFFDLLDRCGVDHPETRLSPPEEPAGWLSKRVGGTGGWHVRRLTRVLPVEEVAGPAGETSTSPGSRNTYYQREVPGIPMSALFLADGNDIRLVGINRLLFAEEGDRPYVFHGALGPLSLPDAVDAEVRRAATVIARQIGLMGLNSMDFVLADDRVCVLEVNPRPSATLDLHDDRVPGGLMKAHLAACRQRLLPDAEPRPPVEVRGLQIAYARRPLEATRRGRRRLRELGYCHDIGREGTMTGVGEPLCSVSARAGTERAALTELARRIDVVRRINEEEDDD